jgi:anti-sigma B factor antagonist
MRNELPGALAELRGDLLRIETSQGIEGVTVRLAGEFDMASADDVTDAIAEAKKGAGKVVVDLSEVSFLDSTGLQVLLRASSQDKRNGRRLSFVPSKHDAVKQIVSISGVTELLQ